jgi:hypothetical protein
VKESWTASWFLATLPSAKEISWSCTNEKRH